MTTATTTAPLTIATIETGNRATAHGAAVESRITLSDGRLVSVTTMRRSSGIISAHAREVRLETVGPHTYETFSSDSWSETVAQAPRGTRATAKGLAAVHADGLARLALPATLARLAAAA